MTDFSLIYNNRVMNIEDFIDSILYPDFSINKIPSCEIQENSQFYCIQLENYFNSVNEFNEGRGNILDYYFWPMFNTGGQNNESK